MQVEHIREYLASRTFHGRVVFTGPRRRSHSVRVRGDQMAEELEGGCFRTRHLHHRMVHGSPAVIWISEHNQELLQRFKNLAPQILDVINPNAGDVHFSCADRYRPFRYLFLNTQSTIRYLGEEPESGWRTWVVPHHHCNLASYSLPEARVDKPLTVGYIGQPEHLHDTETIQTQVSKLGLRWISADSNHLEAYQDIDIGVAWTRPETNRDETRSNIKLANFIGHGIPSVVCNYESYRDVDRTLGGGATLIRTDLNGLLEGLAELAKNRDLRTAMAAKARESSDVYSRHEIGRLYRDILAEIRQEFDDLRR